MTKLIKNKYHFKKINSKQVPFFPKCYWSDNSFLIHCVKEKDIR